MKVLIACEYSGRVRDAFTAMGHDATSVDLLPSETEGRHIIGDVLDVIKSEHFDLMIGHPPCTDLAVSGARYFAEKRADGREQKVWLMAPSEDRWKDRSRTYQGIARAMASQWGVN